MVGYFFFFTSLRTIHKRHGCCSAWLLFNITGYTNYLAKVRIKEKAKSVNLFLDDAICLICLQVEASTLLQSPGLPAPGPAV